MPAGKSANKHDPFDIWKETIQYVLRDIRKWREPEDWWPIDIEHQDRCHDFGGPFMVGGGVFMMNKGECWECKKMDGTIGPVASFEDVWKDPTIEDVCKWYTGDPKRAIGQISCV